MKYVVLGTDYDFTEFNDLKEAEADYLEKCTEILVGYATLDGDIRLMQVMTSFTNQDVESMVAAKIQKLSNSLPSNGINEQELKDSYWQSYWSVVILIY